MVKGLKKRNISFLFSQYLNDKSIDDVTDCLIIGLNGSSENAFFYGRAIACINSLLSVLIPLRNRSLLVNTKFEKESTLDLDIVLMWLKLNNLNDLIIYGKKNNIDVSKLSQYIDNTNINTHNVVFTILTEHFNKLSLGVSNDVDYTQSNIKLDEDKHKIFVNLQKKLLGDI